MSTAQEYRHLIDECLNWASVCEREPYRTMLFEIAKEWHREAIRLGRPASAQGSTTEHRPFERRVGEKSGGVFERPHIGRRELRKLRILNADLAGLSASRSEVEAGWHAGRVGATGR